MQQGMGVENLVLLGDHKQLNPLVLASGGDFEMKDKKVDRSFMERAMECGCPLHPLRIQYRMPDILCRLVSTLFYSVQLSMGEWDGTPMLCKERTARGSTSDK